jgi:hypothetical protein
MTKYTTVLGDLLRHFSRSDFESTISGYKADFRTRTLKCWDIFKTMIYAHITGCFSVREIETSMKVNGKRLYHAALKPIKRSTFCDALGKRRSDIFRSVFHESINKAQGIAGNMGTKFNNPLRIIDMTVMPLCLSRFNWAKFRKTKGAVKLHMNLDGDNLMPYDSFISNGTVHEKNLLEHLTQESGVIYVMDRGYIDYKSLYNIELRSSIFVTRMKSNCAYKRVKINHHKEDGPVLSDVVIALTGPVAKSNYPALLRKIKYQDRDRKKVYEFVTNDLERDAEEIAAIYKERWEVELFFKWIKQNLKVKTFWGTSMNAVYSHIWVALIVSVLLWILKTLNGIKASSYELLIMLKSTLLTKNSVTGLCTNRPSPPFDYSLQPFLEGFKC